MIPTATAPAVKGAAHSHCILGMFVAAVIVLAMCAAAEAQERAAADDRDRAGETLPPILVTARKAEEDPFVVPHFVSVIPRQEIEERIPWTTPDLLDRSAGVLVQKTNLGGGSIFLRGLTGKHILLLVDGVRMNNSLYRYGPHQYLNTIDPNIIERIEIVRGPMSVLYGSDAMGGTINVITRKPALPGDRSPSYGGLLSGAYGSAARQRSGRVEFEAGVRTSGILAGATYRGFSDLVGGRGVGVQDPTGYEEADADAKMTLMDSGDHRLWAATQFTRQFDVPKTSEVTLDKKIKYNYEPQLRSLSYIRYEGGRLVGQWPDFVGISLSYQVQEEGEEVIKDDPTLETKERNGARTLGAGVHLRSSLGFLGLLSYGAEFSQDWIASSKTEFNRAAGTSRAVRSAFPDDAVYRSVGVYLQEEVGLLDRITVVAGGRYSYVRTHGTLVDPASGAENALSLETDNISGMGQLRVEIVPWLCGVLSVAQAFRAPNMEDFFGKVDFTEEIPNTDLDPERSLNYEAGLKAAHPWFSADLFYFLSEYRDLITRTEVGFEDTNGNGAQDQDEHSIFQRINVGKARMQGVECDVRIRLPSSFTLFGTYSWMRGTNRITGEPLRRIPPMQGTVGIRYQPNDRYWVEGWALFAARQDRLSPEDLKDKRIPEGGTPGYEVFNLAGGYALRNGLDVTLVLENLGNEKYKTHGSGIYEPGTNVMIGCRYRF